MPGIICAIRGGPASRPTIEKAIQVALETKLPIYFLYIINLDFLSHTSSSRTHVISKEMSEMGEFILLTAQSEAEAQGISAEGVIRNGQIVDEIIHLCQEVKADYVILGQPKNQKDENVFTQERLSAFSLHIEEESNAKVILAERMTN
ncbi:MAG: universal stress protein [Chloroflexi bacterium]|nr:universal stress protein [Chloroflexota bacterium]